MLLPHCFTLTLISMLGFKPKYPIVYRLDLSLANIEPVMLGIEATVVSNGHIPGFKGAYGLVGM